MGSLDVLRLDWRGRSLVRESPQVDDQLSPLVDRLARLGWTRIGSAGIFGEQTC